MKNAETEAAAEKVNPHSSGEIWNGGGRLVDIDGCARVGEICHSPA